MAVSQSPTRIWDYRNLVYHLAQRDLKARHKKSLLGWLWSLINPAATLGIYTMVFGVFLKIEPPLAGDGTTKVFALYLFCGLIVWNFFSTVVNGSMMAFQTSGGMLTKVYFPPECPAIANMAVALVQFFIELGIALAFLIGLGVVSWTAIFALVTVVQLALFAIGIGLVVSLWNIRYRDVSYLIGIALQMLFYATPIVYRPEIVPDKLGGWFPIHRLFELNPMTHFVTNMRKALYLLEAPSALNLFVLSVVSVAFAGVGWAVFARSAPGVIEEL